MDEEVQNINEFHIKALNAKRIACKKDNDASLFKIASEFNKDAVSLIDCVLNKYNSKNINFLARAIGAFALRTTDSLKEENFMKLMELALRTNLKGLKGLSDKKNI